MNNDFLNSDRANDIGSNQKKNKKFRALDIVAYILCLALSFGIWAYVVSLENENYEYTFENVPVQLEGVNEMKNEKNLSVISGYDTKVNITVVGSRREILKYSAEDIFAHVNLGGVTAADRHSLDVMVDLPENITFVSSNPSKINVFVDETTTVTVDLEIDLLYSIAADLTIHEPEPSVSNVVVTGPKTILETISHAKITYDLGTVTTSVNFNAHISLVDIEGNEIVNPYVKTDVSDAKVKVPVTKEKELPLVAEYTVNDADRFEYAVTFEPQTVKVVGDPQIVDNMTEIKVDIGNITNSQGGSVITANKLALPDDVKLANKEVKTVSYTVEKAEIPVE